MIDYTKIITAEDKLEAYAAQKLEAIQAEKCRARDAGVVVDGVLFDSDLPARMAYNELAIRFGAMPTFSTPWKASAGSWVTMDAELFSRVMLAGGEHIQNCFAWQSAREQEVAAALASSDKAALEAISTTYA